MYIMTNNSFGILCARRPRCKYIPVRRAPATTEGREPCSRGRCANLGGQPAGARIRPTWASSEQIDVVFGAVTTRTFRQSIMCRKGR